MTNSITPTKILIAIPSKGRAEKMKTTSWLSGSKYKDDVVIFVEPQEIGEYNAVNNRDGIRYGAECAFRIHPIPENDRGLGYAKAQVKDYAETNGYNYIFKLDDDINGFVGRGSKKEQDLAGNFDKLVLDSLEMLESQEDIVAVCFPYRNELYKIKKWVSLNSRLQTAFICKTTAFYTDPDHSIFEDFYTYLKIRANNQSTIRYGLFGMDCEDVGVNPGGHQMFDRGKQTLESLDYLREVYPALEFKKVKGKSWTIEPKLGGPFFNVKQL